ncbi:MAG: CdaR family protein [Patescibacteria group bacterium]|nr:CdaR family protein [Patescibacteria group bacterium]
MLKFLTHNFVAKLICLLIAMGLWIYVASGESKIDNFPGSIALEVRNTPENLVVVKDIDNVTVRIAAERGVWQKLTSSSFSAYIDLTGMKEGVIEVPVTVKSNVDGVDVIEIKPAKITVRLEPIISKSVPVSVRVEGAASEGMVAGDVKAKPDKVEVSGAKFYLEKISEATALVKLNGESEQIEKTVVLSAYDVNNNLIKDVNFQPKEAAITVSIIKGGNTKTVGIVAKTSGVPKSGYWLSQISLDPSTAVITGSSTILAKTNYLETQTINLDGLDSDKSQTAKIELPAGINLVDASKTSVKVQISLSSDLSQRTVPASISYQNVAANLTIAKIDPEDINVVVTGSAEALKSLDSSKVILTLDLGNYKNSGTYALDINKNSISTPAGLQVASFLPSSIRVTLNNK